MCASRFVPRFSYQHSATDPARYFCSIRCRNPELDGRRGRSQHRCAACGTSFTMRYAFQVVATGEARKVVCSEGCRKSVLVPRGNGGSAAAPRSVAVLNQKGGTGKTTTSVSLAAGLALRGHRVLLVDMDAQGNVAVSLGLSPRRTLYHALIDGAPLKEVISEARPNLDVIPSSQALAAAEIQLVNTRDRARALAKRLQPVLQAGGPYDWVIMDCAPSLSLLNQNALCAVREVLVPVSCDYLALVGVKQILRTLEHVKNVLLHPVEVLGVLPTLYDVRKRISKESVEALTGYFRERVMPRVRVNARLGEAPSHKKSIFEYAPDSNGARDYAAVVDWVLATTAAARDEAPAAAAAPAVAAPARVYGHG